MQRALPAAPAPLPDGAGAAQRRPRAGCAGLADNYPRSDAAVVRQLKAAGALVLGKANMGEWALFPEFTTSSLGGVVRNPYHLHHAPAGK